MTEKMREKVNNLRKRIPETGISYESLKELTYHNDKVCSISTLRKYNLLVVVGTYEIEYEDEGWSEVHHLYTVKAL